jgi:two-component system, LytTR family, sensor kinase
MVKFLTEKFDKLQRIEFWAATGILFLVSFIRLLSEGRDVPGPYHFFSEVPRYVVYYIAFLILNFKIVPELVNRKNVLLNIVLIPILFLFVSWINDIIHSYKVATLETFHIPVDQNSGFLLHPFAMSLAVFGIFACYSVMRYAGVYLLSDPVDVQSKRYILTRDSFVVFVFWIVIMFLIAIGDPETGLMIAWGVMIPSGILVYVFAFRNVIPRVLAKRKYPFLRYLLRMFLFVSLISFGSGLLIVIITDNEDHGSIVGVISFIFQMLVSVPLSWVLFRRYQKNNEQLSSLQKELGQSAANFDFLRSQINPHFLFNALNTIYGTAIQEKADRTSEAVLKLSEMMRFMLQENMQEKIPLAKEVDYLKNYITIQKLRTESNPSVSIQTNIEDTTESIQIAPMLLIPFVENAFKHGISIRENSYINISLEVRDKILYFDVHNSKHVKPDSDPEKDKSGIGLNNVKQRLRLLYDGHHDLMIRETGKDFFVHLTLTLT